MSKNLEDYSREELIDAVRQLRRRKTFGLVWEDKPEHVMDKCRDALPVIEEVADKRLITTKNDDITHLLLEGDNYHTLSALNYTHKGRIDVIYIDPPYNRGGDFKYNDTYVDKEDPFKHSKWLSFIARRISLAKPLLDENGVMFISIDDAEYSQLILLCKQLFGDDRVETLIWKKSGFGRDGKMKNTSTFRRDHEYIVVCYNGTPKLNKIDETPDFQNDYSNPDDDPRGPYKAGSISRKEAASNPDHDNYYSVTSPAGKVFTRQFDIPKEDFEALDNDKQLNEAGRAVGRIYWGKKGDAVPALKIFTNEERSITPYSVLLNKGTTTEGTKEASAIVGKDCKKMRPKPSLLLRTLIQLGVKKPDAIVLDFFAGTGTTAQAVLEYNRKYDANVQFIIATNNDEGIVDDFTYPRLQHLAEGKGTQRPLPVNMRYFKAGFVSKQKTDDQTRLALLERCADMIRVREAAYDTVIAEADFQLLSNDNHYAAIIFDPHKLSQYIHAIESHDTTKPVHLYIFSYSNYAYDDDIPETPLTYTTYPIPESILEVYSRIFDQKEALNV